MIKISIDFCIDFYKRFLTDLGSILGVKLGQKSLNNKNDLKIVDFVFFFEAPLEAKMAQKSFQNGCQN